MKYIKGDPNSPSGSLVAFSEVKGYNPIEPNAKILAVHIVVSPLSAHSYNYPVVVFPVSTYKNKDHFFKIVDFIGDCDLIQLDDFQIPEDKDQEEYIKERMKMLNDIVQNYVDSYQRRYATSVQEQDLAIFDYLYDLDFEKLTKPTRKSSNSKVRKSKNSNDNTLSLQKSLKNIEQLLNHTTKTTEEKPRKTKASSSKVPTSRKKNKLEIKIEKFKPYITFIKKSHPEIDITNFELALENNNLELANLYLQKFYAIVDERYETAQYFQNKINELEKK